MSKQKGQGLIDWLFAHIGEEAIDKNRMFRNDGRYYNTNTLMPGLFALCFSGIVFIIEKDYDSRNPYLSLCI
jgi:hypothetical protein